MQKQKRVPTRVHTRELDRAIARTQMKSIGMRRVAKSSHTGARRDQMFYVNSYFANHWREYCVGGKEKKNGTED